MAVLARNVGIKDAFTLREEAAAEGDVPAMNVFQERAFAARADLKSLEVQKQIAADQIKYAEGAFWPTVSVSAGVCRGRSVSGHGEPEQGEHLRRA